MSLYNFLQNDNTLISENPIYGFGLQLVPNLRLLVFEVLPKSLCIDFVSQNLEIGKFYIVPSAHYQFIRQSEKCKFYCIDINQEHLSPSEKRMLYSVKYLQQKSVESIKPNRELFSLLGNNIYPNTIEVFDFKLLKEFLLKPSHQLMQPVNAPNYKHLFLVERFLELLSQVDLRLDKCVMDQFIVKLNCNERALQRACNSIFGICTKDVIKYHILLKATHFLCQQRMPITMISKALGFSSLSAFDKFIKRLTNYSPKIIQQRMLSFGM